MWATSVSFGVNITPGWNDSDTDLRAPAPAAKPCPCQCPRHRDGYTTPVAKPTPVLTPAAVAYAAAQARDARLAAHEVVPSESRVVATSLLGELFAGLRSYFNL